MIGYFVTLTLYTVNVQVNPSNSVSLIILEEGVVGPRKMKNPEKFKNTLFEELWEETTTPKFKMYRSYADNLEASHIR